MVHRLPVIAFHAIGSCVQSAVDPRRNPSGEILRDYRQLEQIDNFRYRRESS